jgi:DNA-binding FadR family transcriptional regulator
LQVRARIEALTASLAASAKTDGDVEQLHIILEAQTALVGLHDGEHVQQLADLDVDFHLAIANASGNEIANEIVRLVVPAFSASNGALLWASQRIDDSIKDHRAITEAIVLGSAEGAEARMISHLARVRDLCSLLEEEGSAIAQRQSPE